MRRLTVACSLIVTVVALAAASWSFADGSARGPRSPGGRLDAGVEAHSAALRPVTDCDQLREYVAEVVLETLINHLYWNAWRTLPWALEGDGSGGSGAPTDYTTTNVQEAGVDEPDLIKTDGQYLYTVEGGALRILRSWPASSTALVSMVALKGYPWGLFLYGDHVMVLSSYWGDEGGFRPRYWSGTRLEVIDVADRTNPVSVRAIDIEGTLAGARLIDGHAYTVVSSYMEIPEAAWQLIWNDELELPEVEWDATDAEREAASDIARDILRPLIGSIVADLRMAEMVPMVQDRSSADPNAEAEPLLSCTDIYLPPEAASYSVLSVLHLDLNLDPAESLLYSTGILADGWTVYASARNLYISQASWWRWWGWGDLDRSTAIHKFELDPQRSVPVRYRATGAVPGWLHNEFSMGEHNGYLRVATTLFDWWWGTAGDDQDEGSVITVLEERGGGLVAVGQVDGIAPGEQIYATRFMGDKGYLVTFERIDPLFTLDLSDPTDPRVVGELEVTGFSSYLHPVDEDHLLAVGMEASPEGQVVGLAVSLFDVSDFANPTLADRYLVELEEDQWSWSEAMSDHHAFTFHRGVLSIPAYIAGPDSWFGGLVVFKIDLETGISELGRVDHATMALPDRYPQVRRSVYIEDYLYSLSTLGLKVNRLYDPSVTIAEVPFELLP